MQQRWPVPRSMASSMTTAAGASEGACKLPLPLPPQPLLLPLLPLPAAALAPQLCEQRLLAMLIHVKALNCTGFALLLLCLLFAPSLPL